jgi:hypothetical protein
MNPTTPWHLASFAQFIDKDLPRLLREKLPV